MQADPGNHPPVNIARARKYTVPAILTGPALMALYLGILVLPVAAAWLQGLPPRNWRDDLSSGLALCAFSGIMMEFLLSGRFRFISNHLGIDATMRVHQLMARTLTLALLIHPFLYVSGVPAYPMPWDTTRQGSVDFGLVTVLTGMAAWIALIVLVLFGIFREQRGGSYEAWRASHGVAAAFVAGFGTLHVLEAGRYSADPFLAGFWIAMLAIALMALAWVYLLKPLWQVRHPYSVRSVRRIAERTWELVVVPRRGEAIPFSAGQFVWLNVGSSPFSLNENPFSIASSAAERGRLEFVIKEVGDFTRGLGTIRPGAEAYVDGPFGNMTVAGREGAGIAFYAGGVGIAPILSILRDVRDRGDTRPMLLFYGNRVAEQIVYGEELDEMTRQLDLTVAHFLSEPPTGWPGRAGMIDEAAIAGALQDRECDGWLHVICGPLPMIEKIEGTLLGLGVPDSRILSERFYYD